MPRRGLPGRGRRLMGTAPESSRSLAREVCLFGQRRQRALGRRTGTRRELRGGAADGRHVEVWCEVRCVVLVLSVIERGWSMEGSEA